MMIVFYIQHISLYGDSSMKFFISDTHFGHANAIKFDNRPFNSVEEMDECMIKLWNETVKPNDEVYHLGDVAFHTAERAEKIIKRLNGHKHLIFGNHDKVVRNSRTIRDLFASTREYHEVREKELRFCLFHYPIAASGTKPIVELFISMVIAMAIMNIRGPGRSWMLAHAALDINQSVLMKWLNF